MRIRLYITATPILYIPREKMATGGIEKEWQQIEEEITCSICGDLFTDPKTIPYLHTFCKQCIEKSIESSKKMASIVCCPLCRASIPLDMSSIPTNFTINRLAEIFEKQKEAVTTIKMKCGNCENGSNSPAITWCVECETSLCKRCAQNMERFQITQHCCG